MSCHIHKNKQEISKCKVCGKPICSECQNIQNYYDACPSCSKEKLMSLQTNYKRGLFANILSVLCIALFFAFYAMDIKNGDAEQSLIIWGAIFGGIFAVVSVLLLVRTIVKISKLKRLLLDVDKVSNGI